MKLTLIAILSWTYFLTAQWVDQYGDRFCRYENGTILNVGMSFCPFSIQA